MSTVNPLVAFDAEHGGQYHDDAEVLAAAAEELAKLEGRKGYPEFDPDQPRDDAGKWSGEGGGNDSQGELFGDGGAGPKPITAGVDFAKNRDEMLKRVVPELTGDRLAKAKALEAELQDAPFIHATFVEAAESILAGDAGIESRARVLDDIKDLRERWADMMRENIDIIAESDLPADQKYADQLERQLDRLMKQPAIDTDGYEILTSDVLLAAHAGEDLMHEANMLLKPIVGSTFKQDRELGLDRYVFGTMGVPSVYGNVYFVVDRAQLEKAGAFISRRDIAATKWDAHQYQHEMLLPKDWAHVAASWDAADLPQQLHDWEAKIPDNVPKSAILGVIVTDSDDWDRLGGDSHSLGVQLHYLPSDAENFDQKVRARATYLQRTGEFPDYTGDEIGYHTVADPK